MIEYRTYKYLIKPTSNQKSEIKKILVSCTKIYNKFIMENGFETYKYVKAKDVLYKYKNEDSSLIDVDSSALINVLFEFQNKNKQQSKVKEGNKILKSYSTSNLSGRQAIYFVDNKHINIPKLGNMTIVMHRSIPNCARIMKATITMDNCDNYYVCLSISFDREDKINKIDITKSIGLDYSSKYLYVDSDGNRCEMRHYYQEQEKRIAKLKFALSKCKKHSLRYYKLKDKIGKIYKRTVNQRNDFLHKLSAKLANEYDLVCVEDLDMNDIAQKYSLAKNTYDNSYGKFLEYLKYKLEARGKVLIKVKKYYPSSKRCSKCGYINNELKLSDRGWVCPNCKSVHDRDINAAINIKNRGIEEFTSIGYLDHA